MISKLLDAVTKQLGMTFGDKYHYYVEDVNQGLTKPCFTVNPLIQLQRSKLVNLYDLTIPIVIHYFTDNHTNMKTECCSVAEQVLDCLEYLPFENTLLGSEDISWQITDDVLQIFVTYKLTTIKHGDDEDMEVLIETNISTTD